MKKVLSLTLAIVTIALAFQGCSSNKTQTGNIGETVVVSGFEFTLNSFDLAERTYNVSSAVDGEILKVFYTPYDKNNKKFDLSNTICAEDGHVFALYDFTLKNTGKKQIDLTTSTIKVVYDNASEYEERLDTYFWKDSGTNWGGPNTGDKQKLIDPKATTEGRFALEVPEEVMTDESKPLKVVITVKNGKGKTQEIVYNVR